jgi:hypothetical protein
MEIVTGTGRSRNKKFYFHCIAHVVILRLLNLIDSFWMKNDLLIAFVVRVPERPNFTILTLYSLCVFGSKKRRVSNINNFF